MPISIEETIKWFKELFELNSDSSQKKEDFCVGTTGDIEKFREQTPGLKLIGVTKCNSNDTVKKLLDGMSKAGFSSENTDDDTALYVYLRKKEQ